MLPVGFGRWQELRILGSDCMEDYFQFSVLDIEK